MSAEELEMEVAARSIVVEAKTGAKERDAPIMPGANVA
jgi:hypothetical protein